jgi:hypothetical protein
LTRQLSGSEKNQFFVGRRQLRHNPTGAVGHAGTYQDAKLPFDASFQGSGLDFGRDLIEFELGEQGLGRAAAGKTLNASQRSILLKLASPGRFARVRCTASERSSSCM